VQALPETQAKALLPLESLAGELDMSADGHQPGKSE
jgi:hypothetical protein